MQDNLEVVTRVASVDVSPDLRESIERAISLVGGIDKFVRPGEVISLKPNLNSADRYPASSDPEFIRVLGEIIIEAGGTLRFVESSMFAYKTRNIAVKTGLLDVARELDAEFVFLDEIPWTKVDVPKGRYLKEAYVSSEILNSANLILAPCLKTHKMARFTGAMKLLMGLVRGRTRMSMHIRNLEMKIAELATLFHPRLIVMDARRVFVTGGPFKGDVEDPGVIIAGTNMLAVDVVAVRLLQSYNAENCLDMPVWKIPQIAHAAAIGLGVSNDADIETVGRDYTYSQSLP